MVVIKKDINKILLFLTIVPILLFLSFSIYYENKLKNISIEYNKSQEKLKETAGNAVLEISNETFQLKESFQKDKEFFEEKYNNLNSENEELKRQRDMLQSQLNSMKSELEDINDKFNILQSRFQEVQNTLIKANEQISSLTARVNELCRKLKEAGGDDEKC